MKKILLAAAMLALTLACSKNDPTGTGNNNGNGNGNGNGSGEGGEQARTEWTLTYVVALPTAAAQYMDLEISHKDASGKVVSDGTLSAANTNEGWPNDAFKAAFTASISSYGYPESLASESLIIKKISVGKVKKNYEDFENPLVAKVQLHSSIPDNITTPTLLPFCILQTEDRTFMSSFFYWTVSQRSPDLKTYLTTQLTESRLDRGFDAISLK